MQQRYLKVHQTNTRDIHSDWKFPFNLSASTCIIAVIINRVKCHGNIYFTHVRRHRRGFSRARAITFESEGGPFNRGCNIFSRECSLYTPLLRRLEEYSTSYPPIIIHNPPCSPPRSLLRTPCSLFIPLTSTSSPYGFHFWQTPLCLSQDQNEPASLYICSCLSLTLSFSVPLDETVADI